MADPGNVDLLKQFLQALQDFTTELADIRADIRANSRKHEAALRRLDELKKTLMKCGPKLESSVSGWTPLNMQRLTHHRWSGNLGKSRKG